MATGNDVADYSNPLSALMAALIRNQDSDTAQTTTGSQTTTGTTNNTNNQTTTGTTNSTSQQDTTGAQRTTGNQSTTGNQNTTTRNTGSQTNTDITTGQTGIRGNQTSTQAGSSTTAQTTRVDADVSKLLEVYNRQSKGITPEMLAAIFNEGAKKTPGLISAYANATGSRATGNTPLATSLNDLQASLVDQSARLNMELLNESAKTAAQIADLTKSTNTTGTNTETQTGTQVNNQVTNVNQTQTGTQTSSQTGVQNTDTSQNTATNQNVATSQSTNQTNNQNVNQTTNQTGSQTSNQQQNTNQTVDQSVDVSPDTDILALAGGALVGGSMLDGLLKSVGADGVKNLGSTLSTMFKDGGSAFLKWLNGTNSDGITIDPAGQTVNFSGMTPQQIENWFETELKLNDDLWNAGIMPDTSGDGSYDWTSDIFDGWFD